MLPEITTALGSAAGLMALAATPPGAPASTGPPLPEPLGASPFAVFLAQSGTPVPKADVPKTNLTPPKTNIAPAPKTNPKQALLDTQVLLDKQALLKSKTMDTLPTLSFPPVLKVKVKASELLLPQTPAQPAPLHQAPAEAKPAPEASAARSLVAGQVIAVPPLSAGPVPALPAVFVPTPAAWEPAPAAFVTPTEAVMPSPTASVPPLDLGTQSLSAAGLFTHNPSPSVPVGSPQAGTLAAPHAPPEPPSSTTPAAGASQSPEPVTASVTKEKPAALMTANALPRVASPISAAPQVQATPQVQIPNTASPEPMPLPPAVVAAIQQSIPATAAAVPSSGPLKPALPKNVGALASALKPSGENADTSTRTPQGQARVVAITGVPAAAPEPMPEKHTAEQKPSGTAESGTNSALPAPPVGLPADAVKTGTKPLTAGERAEVIRQAADGVGAAVLPAKPGAVQQMSVQLHPKDWGSLQVSVTVAPGQEAGTAKTVTAHIIAETPQVKAALQSQTGALHQALRASGLHLEHLTVSVKTSDAKAPEVKPAAQSASAGFSSGQGQPNKSEQSYGQPSAGANGFGTNGFGTNGFGTGGSQNNHQGQPPAAFMPAMADAETDDTPAAVLPLRPAAGRIDTHA